MSDVILSNIKSSGGLPILAPDLTFPSAKFSSALTFKTVSGINAVGSLTTAISLTGKWATSLARLTGITESESVTVKLTIDGVVIWNASTSVTGGTLFLIGSSPESAIRCNQSFLLEVQTTADTSIALDYLARPIL